MTIAAIALIGWLVGFGADQTYRAINPPPVSLSNCPAVKVTVEEMEDGSRIEKRECLR